MIDFIPLELTKNLYLGISCFFLIIILLFWKQNVTNFDSSPRPHFLLTLFVFLHLVFAFDGGDFFHYYAYFIDKDFDAMEKIYSKIARLVGYNYLAFRAIIWGGALFLFQQTSKRFGLDLNKTTFLLYVMFIGVFDYARASLAMSIYFYGLSFICIPNKRFPILSYIIAIGIIFTSILFHRSMAFTVAMTIMAFIPLNPYLLIIILIVFSMSSPLLKDFFYNYIMSGELIIGGDLQDKVMSYSDLTFSNEFSIFEWIRRFLVYSTFILPVLLFTFKVFKKEDSDIIVTPIFKLYKVSIGILLLSISILMISSEAIVIFYRYLFMLMIPVVLMISYARKNGIISHNLFKFFIYLCLTHEIFGMAKLLLGGNLS